MVVFPQGIVGDPGLPGRDGDPGLEVLRSADNDISVVEKQLYYYKCHVFLTGLSRSTRSQWETRTNWSKGSPLILFGFANKCAIELFLADSSVVLCVFHREGKAPLGQQEKWVPRAEL